MKKLILIGMLYVITGLSTSVAKAGDYINELKEIEKNRLFDLNETAIKLKKIKEHEKEFTQKERELFRLLLGHSTLMQSDISSAEEILVELTKESKSVNIKARAYSILTSLYALKGEDVASFMALDTALKMLPKMDNEQYVFDILVNAVSVYKQSELLEFALEHARRLLSAANKQKTDLMLCNSMFELGDIENIIGNKSLAKKRLMLAKGHCEKSDEVLLAMMVDESLSRIDMHEGDYKGALKRLEKMYPVVLDYGWGVMIALYQVSIGEAYFNKNDIDKALQFADSAYKIAKKGSDAKRLELSAALLAKIYTKIDDKDNAIKYYQEYMERSKDNDVKVRQRKLAFEVARRGKL